MFGMLKRIADEIRSNFYVGVIVNKNSIHRVLTL